MQELKCEYRGYEETRSAEDLGTALRLLEMHESSTHMAKEEVKKGGSLLLRRPIIRLGARSLTLRIKPWILTQATPTKATMEL